MKSEAWTFIILGALMLPSLSYALYYIINREAIRKRYVDRHNAKVAAKEQVARKKVISDLLELSNTVRSEIQQVEEIKRKQNDPDYDVYIATPHVLRDHFYAQINKLSHATDKEYLMRTFDRIEQAANEKDDASVRYIIESLISGLDAEMERKSYNQGSIPLKTLLSQKGRN